MKQQLEQYELWQDDDGFVLISSRESNDNKLVYLSNNPKLIHTILAETGEDAKEQMQEFIESLARHN